MKRRLLVPFLFTLFVTWLLLPLAGWAATDNEDGDEDEGEDNPWGESAIDHKLNVGWDYPAEYVKRPLGFNKSLIEFGAGLEYKYVHHFWNDDGELIKGSFKTKKQTLNVHFGMGITDNLSFSINWPFVYKKTQLYAGNQNYRESRENTYGVLAEEAFVEFLDHSDPWQIWEMDLPWMGDVEMTFIYQFIRLLDPTTSLALESTVKWPTGNDNPRRSSQPRNYLTSGQTDWYNGLGFKQSVGDKWGLGITLRGGYLWRMPGSVKYAPGELDLADQMLADAELAFQIPGIPVDLPSPLSWFWPFNQSWAIAAEGHYMQRVVESTVEDSLGNEVKMGDQPGYEMSVEPKLIFTYEPNLDLVFAVDVPLAGQSSFLSFSRSYYVPPYEIEGNDGVGVNYTIGLTKRWQ